MRRKECERDAAFAWEVLKNSIYSTVSMVCPDGTPYALSLIHISEPTRPY